MMTYFHKYLVNVLNGYELSPSELEGLRNVFEEIKNVSLREIHKHNPRISYGGSYAKRTMVANSYDLDVVILFPPTIENPVRKIFDYVKGVLENAGHRIETYGVALQFKHKGYDIDVVPGKAKGDDFVIANLYNIAQNKVMRTSLKEHIENVRDVRSIIKLMKIWRMNHDLNWHKLAMEQTVVRVLEDKPKNDYGKGLEQVFLDIKSNMHKIKFFDPANSNNPIYVNERERNRIKEVAENCYLAITREDYKYIIC